MSSYSQALLFLACALPVSSVEPLFIDKPQAADIAFVNLGLGPAEIESPRPGGEYQVFCAVPIDRHYAIHRSVNRLISE